jgi:hypothetical protein
MNILHFLALNGGGQREISIFPFFFSLFKSLYLLFSGALLLIYGPRLAVCKGSLAKASIGWAIRTVSVLPLALAKIVTRTSRNIKPKTGILFSFAPNLDLFLYK